MTLNHREKTSEGDTRLAEMRSDITAFKNAEAQETPTAERLEFISRQEMERGIADLAAAR